MKLRHLIVGSGHMGKFHGSILESFGDIIEYVDLGFDPSGTDYRAYDSVLICTPPETHVNLITEIARIYDIPIFVEKPIIPYLPTVLPGDMPDISMVACNWRWCDCIKAEGEIISVYKTTKQAAGADLIHFYDLFWDKNGEPEMECCVNGDGGWRMTLERQDKKLISTIIYDGKLPQQTWHGHNGGHRQLHMNGFCPMFIRQMEAWRAAVIGKIQSPNTISMAVDRMIPLLRLVGNQNGDKAQEQSRDRGILLG